MEQRVGRRCIFCDARANSAEHLWAEWLHPLIDHTDEHSYFAKHGTRRDQVGVRKERHFQGTIANTRFKRVCASCNNEWMSRAEGQVAPYLTAMFKGQQLHLTAEIRQEVLSYLTYKLIILDWSDADPVMHKRIAHKFYENRLCPWGLRIWLFHNPSNGAKVSYICDAAAAYQSGTYLGPGRPKNVRTMAMDFGGLFVFAYYSATVPHAWDYGSAAVELSSLKSLNSIWPTYQCTADQVASVRATLSRLRQER